MNRHHPYGGYDERSARGGGRGGAPMSTRPRPPHAPGMSPPIPNTAVPYPQPGVYDPASSGNETPYFNTDPYAAANDFSGGADRHYSTPPTGPMSMRGGGRGGMPMRGGIGGRPSSDPRLGQGRPMPHQPLNQSERLPPSAYTPASYENAYTAQNPYEQPNQQAFAQGRPPYNPRPMQQQPNVGGAMSPANYGQSRPPQQAGPSGPAQQYGMGSPSFGNQYGASPAPGFGGPRPPPTGPAQFGGGGMGGPRGGGFARGGGGGVKDSANEKPCRTLFVRNVQFETDSKTVKAQFQQFGEIKTFFDMVNKRGIAFITYFDLRSAHAAMAGMKGTLFGGRPIDIHYSLPRDEDKAQRCDRDKNQGTLFTILKQTNQTLTEENIYQVFGEFGDVKSLRDYKDQANCRFVEYFDSRACQFAHDQLNGKSYMGGVWELKFAWDLTSNEPGPGPGFGPGATPAAGPGAGWSRPPVQSQAPPSAASDRAPLPHDYPSFDDKPQAAAPNYGGYGGAPAGGYGQPTVPPTGPPVDNGWGKRSSATPASEGTPTSTQPDANRLEQAQKVQQLLASLGAAAKGGATPAPPTPAAPAPAASANASLSPPPASIPGGGTAPGLPANIAALLQQASGAPKVAQPPKPQSPPGSQAGQDNGQQSMHQLLSMLNQNRPPPQ